MTASGRQRGFSLIELAVVLVIIGLLVGGGIAALTATSEQAQRAEQRRQFAEAREALYGFAMGQGRLPCPDTDDNDTQENPDGSGCETNQGRLPSELGVGQRDAWGHPILYRVEEDFAGSASPHGAAFAADDDSDLIVDGNLTVLDANGNTIVQDAPAVLVSFGPQGRQVWREGGYVCPGHDGEPSAGFSADETENCDEDITFRDSGYRRSDAAGGRFDDVVVWVPPAVLASRRVDVGKLP